VVFIKLNVTMENIKKDKKEFKKPNLILFWLFAVGSKLYAKLALKTKYKKEKAVKKLKRPFIVLSTHSCFLDIGLMITGMFRRLNIVCGRDVLSWGFTKPLKKALGLIPISQFTMDLSALRKLKKAVDNNLNLAICPEGKISIDGKNLHYMPLSVAKLLKFLGVDVVFMHAYGGHNSKPKWFRGGVKRGSITQEISMLFTKEQLKEFSADEVYAVLKEKFNYNDHLYQAENNIRFKSKNPAKGLHYILFKCPKCNVEYEMDSNETELFCETCKNTAMYTEYGKLLPKTPDCVVFDRIDLWFDWQRECIKKEVSCEDFYESRPVVWDKNEGYEYIESGEGELYINNEVIGFKGKKLNGEDIEFSTPLKPLYTVVQKIKEAVDLTIGNDIHRFYFRDIRFSARYALIVEEKFKYINGI